MRTIIITGSNRGIGLELCKTLIKQNNVKILATCRNPGEATELSDLAKENRNIEIIQLDISDTNSIAKAAETFKEPLDILINNAGIIGKTKKESLGQVTQENILSVFKTNAAGPLLVIQAFLNHLQQGKEKKIINISSSMGSITGNTEGGSYSYRASKAALNSITKSLSIDLKPLGIMVVAIHPGWVQTDMGGPSAAVSKQESVNGILKVINGLSLSDSGKFLRFDNREQVW